MAFWKKTDSKHEVVKGVIKGEIGLISLHIPKTAGSSFRETLRDVYGETSVLRVDHNKLPAVIPAKVKVLHGHFQYREILEHYGLVSDIPVVTWLRDPVERVISNFYYLQKILKEHLEEEKNDLDVISKMQKTLLEYASANKNRNRMSKFLEGIELRQMLFVGISEAYDDDLLALSKMLGWPGFEPCRHNRTGNEKEDVSEEIREEIRELNLKDVELYNEALALREDRLSGSRSTV